MTRDPAASAIQLADPTFNQPAFVARDAVVVGDVTVERDANVWFGAVARGDIEQIVIGEGANVQDGCVLHADAGFPCVIGPNCTVGHRAVVHGAKLGEHALIGIGAIVLNGAEVGDFAMIGAGAVVPEGMVIPPRTLAVGIPAKVRRELTEDEVTMLRLSAMQYIEKGKVFQAAGHGRPELD